MNGVGWDEASEVASWRGLPPLDGDTSADACVIGLGGSGLAAIESLIDRGLSVVGLDAGRVAAGAAGRNGGVLVGGPDAYLHAAIDAWGEDAAVWLYRATLRELDHLASLVPHVVNRVGSIRLAGLPGDPESADEAAEHVRELRDCELHEAALTKHGIAVERYDGSLGRGLYLPDEAAMNPAQRAIGLATLLQRRSRLHEHTRVLEVGPEQVITERGTVTAGIVVVALDGRLEVLLPQLAGRVRTARLQMIATAPVSRGRLHCPVYGRWGYDYAQQSPDGRLFVGGGRDRFEAHEWTTDAEPTEEVQRYIEHIAARFACAPVSVTHRWAASAGFTTGDGRALCTAVDDGVVAVGGYNGTGNLVGPVAARAAVELALDGTLPPRCFAS